MAVRRETIDVSFETPIPVLVESSFSIFRCSSYSRGYNVCKDVWCLIAGDESLICEPEETNGYDWNAISIMFDDCISKKFAGHVPFDWSKLAAKFL